MKLVNLTPHELTIVNEGHIVLPKSDTPVRVSVEKVIVSYVNGIPVSRNTFGKVDGLPNSEKGTMYIVSRIVLEASDRVDLLCPDELVRDDKGNVIGCKTLSCK